MSDERKKPGWKFWATVVVALVLLYPISFGPVAWVLSAFGNPSPAWALSVYRFVYAPIFWVADRGPEWATDAIEWYFGLFL